MRVDNIPLFEDSLSRLKGKTHGDTLAIFLALKYHQNRLPVIGGKDEGVSSGELETLLDEFYSKRHPGFRPRRGRVCRIFQNSFTPPHSNAQNNWRDFFRYALGVSCLASEEDLQGPFLWQDRAGCQHLTSNSSGSLACDLHPKKTRYIRGLDKPKLLKWELKGNKGLYKLTDLNNSNLLEVIRPLSSRVPLDQLIVALYFGASWSNRRDVSVERFASDFHFDDANQVEYLFAVDLDDPETRVEIEEVKRKIKAKLRKPFSLTATSRTVVTTYQRKVRTRAFTEVVRDAYDRACAVCGLRLDAPDGKWEVQAAHIYPHGLDGIDDIRNGLALCHTHHWAFDHYVFTIDENYELRWQPGAGPTLVYVKGKIRLPQDVDEWPNQDQALAWHRARFRSGKS